ncbi:phage tail protein [Yersinia pseudotuberculosis]|uniref:phage tail protein n=3 Tax=Yersinia pseudotuberculosis complex TaxID=1649845 RepID=UPI0005E88992|nr:phage tail protein [Yersinia pseudotuberculosis]CFV18797.1 tail fiber protein [Yersinia pseudotuberculosis]
MTAKFYALMTNLGAAKLANATALGTQLQITHMAVGDGGGVLPTPNPAQTQLIGEKRHAALNSLSIDEVNSSQIIAEQVIPETDGGWWIREIGLFDKDGILIAIANCPETYKPQLQEGSGRTQTVRMVLIVSSTAAVTLKIDPSVVLATRKYADDKAIEVRQYADKLLSDHVAATDPHDQYLRAADNLAGVNDKSQGRKNMGLGKLAQLDELAFSDVGAASANDVVSRTRGGTFDKSLHVRDTLSAGNIKSETNIDASGIITSRNKIECRSPGSDAYSAGFRCYIRDSVTSITTDYVNTHPEGGEQWMFATNYNFVTGGVDFTTRGHFISNGIVRAGGLDGGFMDGSGNITGAVWGEGGGNLWGFINNKIAGVLAQFGKRHFAGSDYIRIPDVPGGLIVQWMTGPVSAGENIAYPELAFPTAFPVACLMAFTATQGNDTIQADVMFQTSRWNNSTVKVFPQWFGTAQQNLCYPLIFAIGY